MNIAAGDLRFLQSAVKIPGKLSFAAKTVPKKEEAAESAEASMIRSFKESNSPKNSRVDQIYAKFCAGKELTAEELDYLAKNNPGMYKEVMEILREREAIERELEMAETKAEVAAVCMNSLTRIKEAMGVGGEAEGQAMTMMARTSQVTSAQIEFKSSAEYGALEDEKSQAEDRREENRVREEKLAEYDDNPDASNTDQTVMEKIDKAGSDREATDTEGNHNTGNGTEKNHITENGTEENHITENGIEEADTAAETEEEQERRLGRRRKRKHPVAARNNFAQTELLYEKTRELYRGTQTVNQSSQDSGSSRLDVSL